jgi:hypothetical protein
MRQVWHCQSSFESNHTHRFQPFQCVLTLAAAGMRCKWGERAAALQQLYKNVLFRLQFSPLGLGVLQLLITLFRYPPRPLVLVLDGNLMEMSQMAHIRNGQEIHHGTPNKDP